MVVVCHELMTWSFGYKPFGHAQRLERWQRPTRFLPLRNPRTVLLPYLGKPCLPLS